MSRTAKITPLTGPNGAESFLNCGVEGSGWTPPPVTVGDLIAMDLATALKAPNTPFKNCAPYVSLFEQYGGQFGGTCLSLLFGYAPIIPLSTTYLLGIHRYAREFVQPRHDWWCWRARFDADHQGLCARIDPLSNPCKLIMPRINVVLHPTVTARSL